MKTLKKAIYPGSFDPIHMGHINIIKRASTLFDELYVAVSHNVDKKQSRNLSARFKTTVQTVNKLKLSNVKVIQNNDMVITTAKKLGCKYIVRSIRDAKDAKYEIYIAQNQNILDSNIETVLFVTDSKLKDVSSTNVKELQHQRTLIAKRNK